MRHPACFRTGAGFLVALASLGLLTGCEGDPEASESFLTDANGTVRIVEVLSAPADAELAFIELRNDSEDVAHLGDAKLEIDGKEIGIKARPVEGSAEVAHGDEPSAIPPHRLGLIVEAGASAEQIHRLACESGIATTRERLGPEHASQDDVLAGTLDLQRLDHCVPVFEASGLREKLAGARTLALVGERGPMDHAATGFGSAPKGVAFERRGLDAEAFDLSPIGSTPAARNYYRSDRYFLQDEASPLPLSAYVSSPWRIGDRILELTELANQLDAAGDAAGADAARNEIAGLQAGQLPENPIVAPFHNALSLAHQTAVGSFFQIEQASVIDLFIGAKQSGVDVKLTTDAMFIGDASYDPGFARLGEAGIPLAFDLSDGRNRPALSHNKFLTMDGEWVWTGSFNPVEDEPHRIHADNALLIRSKEAAALHEQEFETIFSGIASTAKRSVGLAGGNVHVDGASLSFRFSPGITSSVLSKRSGELARTGDVAKACEVRTSSGKNIIPDRYRSLDPCGGPYDLIVSEVARAKSSVYFVSFSLSLDDLSSVLKERMTAGVDIKGVVDPTVSTRGIVTELTDMGADVRYTPNSNPDCPAYISPRSACPANPNKVWLHHKFVVIDYGTDHPVVITGSHNLSTSAEDKNDETLIVIRDRAIAESYFKMFREAYNHPQAMGVHRDTDELPALAITEVQAAADPAETQWVEITNLDNDIVPLSGLKLWNRRGAFMSLDSTAELAPGDRAVVAVGDASRVAVDAGVPVLGVMGDPTRPVIDLRTSLVLLSSDGRWLSTYDPTTSEQNLPEGASPGRVGTSMTWAFDGAMLDAEMVALTGINTTPSAEVPTWEPRGLYSDWGDGFHVTPVGILLMEAPKAAWAPTELPTPGR